jgi:Aldehyde dehydrogenase family
VKALKLGDPLDEASDVGTIINEKQFNKVCGYVEEGLKRREARVVIGGLPPKEGPALTQHSNRVSTNASLGNAILRGRDKGPRNGPSNSIGRLQRQNAWTNRRQFGAIRTEPGNPRLLRTAWWG